MKWALMAIGLMVAFAGPAVGQDLSAELARSVPPPGGFAICKSQTYALCAVAKCFMYNSVAYCSCDIKSGDSISLPLKYGRGRDVCTANAEGAANGYMISTFSLPPSVVAPVGGRAMYDCPAATSDGTYAQCDGGACFYSTVGQSFPGFNKPLGKGQIICSCPTITANPATAKIGFQIAGPYPCQNAFFRFCNRTAANTSTGSHVYVGAATGTATLLTRKLYGFSPQVNECHYPPGGVAPN
jgi:hypothetical protein